MTPALEELAVRYKAKLIWQSKRYMFKHTKKDQKKVAAGGVAEKASHFYHTALCSGLKAEYIFSFLDEGYTGVEVSWEVK